MKGILETLIAAVLRLVSVFVAITGFGYLQDSLAVPSQYRLFSASAPQVTQVYSEAMYYGLLAIGYFLLAIFIQVLVQFALNHLRPIRSDVARLESTFKQGIRMLVRPNIGEDIRR